ncbi:hypothetical protein [Geobacter grbiciae]|uniref:hypothetical protein n=1 Tax=Geobacter grbiciae TaxID=155042 RepID=UPI001C0151FE|nr:hypothetical protein [Geobacter grbiciae]MBT1076694.1 hypothetical protein [Geobacter grbiciae]
MHFSAEIVSLAEGLSARIKEEDTGAEQINKAIQQLDQVIQQNASASEQMASTSEELASQAEQLQTSVAFFKTGNDGMVRRHSASLPKMAKQVVAHIASGQANGYPKRESVPVKKVVNAGIDLDLDGERLDEQFERY